MNLLCFQCQVITPWPFWFPPPYPQKCNTCHNVLWPLVAQLPQLVQSPFSGPPTQTPSVQQQGQPSSQLNHSPQLLGFQQPSGLRQKQALLQKDSSQQRNFTSTSTTPSSHPLYLNLGNSDSLNTQSKLQGARKPRQTPRTKVRLPSASPSSQTTVSSSEPKLRKKVKKALDPDFEKHWGGLNHSSFYDKVSALLRTARDGAHPDHDKAILALDQLLLWYKDKENKKVLDGYVRVDSQKLPGMESGAGLDELFKTSETPLFIKWSYKPPFGKVAFSAYRDGNSSMTEFDWVDAQRFIRLSTELIIWASDKVGNVVSGHTGSLQKFYRLKWMTQKQSNMHELRQAEIERRNSPAAAITQALEIHLRLTVNLAMFNQDLYKDAEEALLVNGASLAGAHAETAEALVRNRDKIKLYLDGFQQRAFNPPWTEPLSPIHPTNSQGLFAPHSPISSRATSPIRFTLSDGERLPTLHEQVRTNWPHMNQQLDQRGVSHGPISHDPNMKKRKKGSEEDEDL